MAVSSFNQCFWLYCASFTAFVGAFLPGIEADAQTSTSLTYRVQDGVWLTYDARSNVVHRLTLPCEGEVIQLSVKSRHFAACKDRLVILDTSTPSAPAILETRATSGRAASVAIVDGEVLVGIERATLETAALETLEAASSESMSATRDRARESQRIEAVRPGVWSAPLGLRDGVELGDRVELYEVLERDGGVERTRLLTTATIIGIAEESSLIETGLNVSIPKDTIVINPSSRKEATSPGKDAKKRERVAHPTRTHEAGITIRPVVQLVSGYGGGALLDAYTTLRISESLSISGVLNPFALAAVRGVQIPSVSFGALGNFDGELFGFGLGLGFASSIDDPTTLLNLFQRARIGTVDGLNLRVLTQFSASNGELGISGLTGDVQIPVGRQNIFWVCTRGGFSGRVWFSDIGIRRRIRGNGLDDSLFLTGSVGVAGLGFGEYDPDVIGPTVGIGAQWRFKGGVQ